MPSASDVKADQLRTQLLRDQVAARVEEVLAHLKAATAALEGLHGSVARPGEKVDA